MGKRLPERSPQSFSGVKGRRRRFCLACMLVVSLSACTDEGNRADPAGTSGLPARQPPAAESAPITITTVEEIVPSMAFKNGDTPTNNWHTRWAKEKHGIDFKYLWTANSNAYLTKLRLSLTANEPLPDAFFVYDFQLAGDLMDAGKLLDISEAFERYASPRLQELYARNPEAWYPVTRDGKKYGLPVLSAGDVQDTILFIRQDWLDKLKLDAPETLEEFERVMDAFVRRDPDGNGLDDTIGMSVGIKDSLFSIAGDASWLFGAYGDAIPEQWIKLSDGELSYGSIQPNARQALAKYAEWMRKGYLDPEIALMDGYQAAEAFNAGKSGIYFGAFWSIDWPLGEVGRNAPEAIVKAYPLPKGPDGQTARRGTPLSIGLLLFNEDFEHMEALLDYYDALYGFVFSEPSDELKYGFAEGYDYVLVDGEPSYDDARIPGGKIEAKKSILTNDEPNIPYKQTKIFYELYHGKKPESHYEKYLLGSGSGILQAGAVNYGMMDASIRDHFAGIPTPTMRDRNEYLRKLEKGAFTSMIYGDQPVESFDDFVRKWKLSGGDEITKEVNEWFRSVRSD